VQLDEMDPKYRPEYSEAAIIQHILIYGTHFQMIFGELEQKYFTKKDLGEAFRIAKTLYDAGRLAGPSYMDELLKEGLQVITSAMVTADNLYFIRREMTEEELASTISYIKEIYVRNLLIWSDGKARDPKLLDLLQPKARSGGQMFDQSGFGSMVQDIMSRDTEQIPYPYGFFNHFLGGIRKKEYTVIAARPSVGKSVMLEQIFWDATKRGKKCLFVSLEMGVEAIFKRHILRTKGINMFREIISKEKKIELLDELKGQMGESKIAAGTYNAEQIVELAGQNPYDILLLDYLQIVSVQNSRMSEFEKVTHITKTLSQIKNKYDLGLVVASQYSRGVKNQPKLSDLRSSGQIEQDADVVLSLWKNAKEADKEDFREIYVDCLKNRNAQTFCNYDEKSRFVLAFKPSRVSFYDVSQYQHEEMEAPPEVPKQQYAIASLEMEMEYQST
jgi:replicative DNA helicase